MSGEETAVMIVMSVMSVPLAGIITWHRQQIEKIRASKPSSSPSSNLDAAVLAELNQVKEQLLALRDTTTKFDLSFDASLDNMEERMKRVEERQLSQTYGTTEESSRVTLGR